MSLVRSVVLVDGENLTLRYQALLERGRTPKQGVFHIRDVCVWYEHIRRPWIDTDVARITYYTSMAGDDPAIADIQRRIAAIQYYGNGDLYGFCQLLPKVFKKARQSQKSRLVDITIAIDAMRHAYANEIDVIYILSGDGDFLSLVEEIGRAGKKVVVMAFSSGLDVRLKAAVDRFIDLDEVFFEPLPEAAAVG